MNNTQRFVVIALVICVFLRHTASYSLQHSYRRNKFYSHSSIPRFPVSLKVSNFISRSSSPINYAVESSDVDVESTVRSKLRKVTGFSLTALRATMRAATGISLTAVYVSTLAISGIWIRQTMRFILDLFPTWARYFAQPFLVMYYVPLFVIRNMTAPKRRERKQAHDALVESWKQAVATAEHSTSYWPIHLNENGEIEPVIDDVDINDAIAKSVEITFENNIEK